MLNFNQQLPPLSLYIHFPWCIQKCPYCDFNSHQQKENLPEVEYIDSLLQDLENDLPLIWGRKVSTIFMGGGTPSLFSPAALEKLLNGIRARVPLSPFAEITMEANPGSLENEKLFGFYEAGINRISLGVQSFNDNYLKTLGRIHDANKAMHAIELAKQAGFENINIDLMHALPDQTLEQALTDIKTALSFATTHISYYELTLEPNTLFYRNPPKLPDADHAWDIFQQGLDTLSNDGFERYEISAFSRDKQHCKHNINYWQFGDYLGIGAGAHAKISDANQQSVTRYTKKRHPKEYLFGKSENNFISSTTTLDEQHLVFEFLLNALRLTSGFTIETFEKHTGLDKNILLNQLETSIDENLVELNEKNNTIKASNRGLNFLNNILEPLVPNPNIS